METSLLNVYCQQTPFLAPISQASPAKSSSLTEQSHSDATKDFLAIVSQLQGRSGGQDTMTPGSEFELTKRSLTVKSADDGYGFVLRASAPAVVSQVREESAASRASLRRGDLIVKVNGHDVTRRSHGDLINLINYMPGSPLTFTVLSPSYADGASEGELRRAWARNYLPNFLASAQSGKSDSPTISHSRTSSSASVGQLVNGGTTGPDGSPCHTPPPYVRPRGQSSAAAVARHVDFSMSSRSNSVSSLQSPISPVSSGSMDMENLDPVERKRLLLSKGTVNIFAAPTTPSRSMSSATSSAYHSPLASPARAPPSRAATVADFSSTTPAFPSALASRESPRASGAAAPPAPHSLKLVRSDLALTQTPPGSPDMKSEKSTRSASVGATSSPPAKPDRVKAKANTSFKSVKESWRRNRKTPDRPPPSTDVALRKISEMLNKSLPPKNESSPAKTAKDDVETPTPAETLEKSPASNSVGMPTKRLSVGTATVPAWQWSADQVRKWLIVNGFSASVHVDRLKDLEGLQLLSLKANADIWNALGVTGTKQLLTLINGLRMDLSLDAMSWPEPALGAADQEQDATVSQQKDVSFEAGDATASTEQNSDNASMPIIEEVIATAQDKQESSSGTTVTHVAVATPTTVTAVNVSQRPQRPPPPSLAKKNSSLSGILGVSASDVSSWQAQDVEKWLLSFGELEHMLYADVFAENAVTGHTLLRIDNNGLIEMGVADQALRKRMLRSVEELRLSYEERELRQMLSNPSGRQSVVSQS